MKPQRIPQPGERFVRLTVIRDGGYVSYPSGTRLRKIVCFCDCGNETVPLLSKVLSGYTKSCGCLHKEAIKVASKKHGESRGGSAEYRAWQNIKARCTRKSNKHYKNYGGRGITVCDEWLGSFEAFLYSVGRRPTEKHTLDRIDNDLGYSPGNVRWITRAKQNRNKRNTSKATIEGITRPVLDWCDELGISIDEVRRARKVVNKKLQSTSTAFIALIHGANNVA